MEVATRDTPVGPFTIVHTRVPVEGADEHPGDVSIFVDDDGTGYFIYTTLGLNHPIRIERMTADFYAVAGEVDPILSQGLRGASTFSARRHLLRSLRPRLRFLQGGSGARVLWLRTR